MTTVQTVVGKRGVARAWFHDGNHPWYAVLLESVPVLGNVPADADQEPGYYANLQVLPGSGYSGVLGPYSFDPEVWNATQERYDQPASTIQFSGSGGSVSFLAFCGVRGHKGLPPQSCTLSGQTFTATGHGLVDGDRIILKTDGGTLPTGYTEAQVVEITNASANDFEIRELDTSAISLSGSPSNLFVIPVNDDWSIYRTFTEAQVVGDGETQDIAIAGFGDTQEVV